MNARQRNITIGLGVAAGAIGVGGLIYFLTRKTSSGSALPGGNVATKPQIPPHDPPGGGGPGYQFGKPGVTTGPGPFDPVDIDWKRKNAPDWWPF